MMNINFYLKKPLTRGWLLAGLTAVVLLTVPLLANAADINISGKVTDAKDGNPLPGVNIVVKGTPTGTVTDSDGRYSLVVDENATLVFSYIGYTTQEVPVSGRTIIDLALEVSTETLDEVVVTALGIERAEQSLGFSYTKVKGSDLTAVVQENALSGLAGRVPGVTINSTGAAGSTVRMSIRGVKSLTGDNQPLFVIDGVPVINSVNNISEIGRDNKADYGNALADLNPENIESMTILKGASAAALYGSRANNGVVLITTKNGRDSKRMTVSISSNNVVDVPFKTVDFIDDFGPGFRPYTPDNNPYPNGVLQIEEAAGGSLGPALDKGYYAIQFFSPRDANGVKVPTPLVSHPDNFKNFFQNGVTSTNDISLSNSTDLATYRLSYSNMQNKGIVPGSDLFRNVLNFNTSLNVSSKVKVSSMVDLSRSNSNNRPATNRGANPLQWLAYFPNNVDVRDFEDYWAPGKEGLQQFTVDEKQANNPYFLAHQVKNAFVRDRVFGNLKVDWEIAPGLSLMGRYSLDMYEEKRETKIAKSYTLQPNGAYGIINMKNYESNADFLLNYDKEIGPLNLTASVGGNTRYNESSNNFAGTKNNTGLILPGVYTLQNIKNTDLAYSSYLYKRGVNSVYGLLNLNFKEKVYLDLTGRNDWSSTLPEENRSYFYPSASLSVLPHNIFNLPAAINMLKLRGGVAQAGSDTGPYQLYPVMGSAEAWGSLPRLTRSGGLLSPGLKPEKSTSYEGGLDVSLFGDKLRFEGTYYHIDNENQILSNQIPYSSGYGSLFFNAGLVMSRGIELSLGGTPIDKGIRVDLSVNYSKNEAFIEELAEGQNIFTFWRDAKGGAWTHVGERIGDIYDAGLVKVTDKSSPYYGYPLLDEEGFWQSNSADKAQRKIGNYNPNFIMGAQSTVSYKRFALSFSLDWRHGGVFVSQTLRYTESDARSQRQLDRLIDRNGLEGDALADYLKSDPNNLIIPHGNVFPIVGGPHESYGGLPDTWAAENYDGLLLNDGAFIPGVIAEYDDEGNIIGYIENLGGAGTRIVPFAMINTPWDFTEAATFDASFVKLREVALSYSIPPAVISRLGLRTASFSVYSRNIMLWTAAKINIDPETAFQQEAGVQAGMQFKQGIERYNVTPWVLPLGVKLNLTF